MSTKREDIDAFQFERRRRPLKLGIRQDLEAILGDQVDRKLLGAALKQYTNNLGYRQAQKIVGTGSRLTQPASFPIPGRGLVIGVTFDCDWCSARISLEQLTARVSFTRRKLRGVAARRGMLPGEMWFGPVAPVIEER